MFNKAKHNHQKRLLIVLCIASILNISACARQNWGDCPVEHRAKIIKIADGSSKTKEVITVKLLSTKKEFSYPEYTKGQTDRHPKKGDYFCTAENHD